MPRRQKTYDALPIASQSKSTGYFFTGMAGVILAGILLFVIWRINNLDEPSLTPAMFRVVTAGWLLLDGWLFVVALGCWRDYRLAHQLDRDGFETTVVILDRRTGDLGSMESPPIKGFWVIFEVAEYRIRQYVTPQVYDGLKVGDRIVVKYMPHKPRVARALHI